MKDRLGVGLFTVPTMAEAARVLGQHYVVLPSIPAGERQSLEGYRRMADTFNQIGARAGEFARNVRAN